MGEIAQVSVMDNPVDPLPREQSARPLWRRRIAVAVLSFILAAGIGWGVTLVRGHIRASRELRERQQRWLALKPGLEADIRRFNGECGVIIKDLSSNWEFTYRQNKRFPAASLLKLPIMLAILDASERGKINLYDTLQLRDGYKTGGSGVLKTLPAGTVLTIHELLEFMIGASDNTATNILIGMMDYPYFNTWFEGFGLRYTNLSRKMMDFRLRKKGVENYTSAADISFALEKIYRREFINCELSEQCLLMLKKQRVKDRIPARLPDGTVVAHKTGLENRICHDAGIVFTPNGDFLICVLTRDAPNSKKAKQFIASLASRVYRFYEEF